MQVPLNSTDSLNYLLGGHIGLRESMKTARIEQTDKSSNVRTWHDSCN